MTNRTLQLLLMLALTFSTGIVDAVGYLGLDRVFVANMTGNVVILGMALTGSTGLPILGPALALAAFFVGAALDGRALRRSGADWTGATTAVLLVVAVAQGAVAVVLARTPGVPVPVGTSPPPNLLWVTVVLALVMGAQGAAARRLAIKDVTTVVITSTLVGLAADSPLGGGGGEAWRRRLAAVVLILLGATVGAALLNVHPGAGMWLAAAVTLAVAVVGHAKTRVSPQVGRPV